MIRVGVVVTEFRKELEALINRYSKENGSNTPDFILAEFLIGCLDTFDKAVSRRSKWYAPDGENPRDFPGGSSIPESRL